MIALTLRQRNIIEYLLSRDSYVTNDVIASNFEVSNRTVRKDLEVIAAYLKEQGMSLVRKPGKGVWIENKQEVLFDDLSCSYSKNERIVIYVTSLLLNDVNTFMTLASSCGVSKQTVINDLNTIEKFLDGYHLSLIKNQGVGTSLEGDETDIRRLFIDLLFTNDHSKIVYELCINNDGIQRNLDVSFELITVIENEFRFRYVDRDRISIVLSFLLNRLGLMKTKNSTIQSSDMERINSILSTKISDSNDQEYISSFLLGERVEGSLTLDSKVEDEANEISEHLISSLKKIHYFDSEDMKDIIRSLTVHVRAAIKEIGFIHKPVEVLGKEFDNPVTTSNYIFTYNAVIKAGYDLENIKDDGGNESTQTITVTLPKASIFDSYLDEKSYVQYWEGEKITANVGLDDIHKEKKRMLKEAKQDAIKGGLYEKTAEHAKVVITDYIHSLKGYENYNVVFNEEA